MFRYCWLCLAQWKNSNGRTRGDLGTCPECREQVRSETRVLAIEHMIEELTDKMGPEKKKEREEKIAERKGILVHLYFLIYNCFSVQLTRKNSKPRPQCPLSTQPGPQAGDSVRHSSV